MNITPERWIKLLRNPNRCNECRIKEGSGWCQTCILNPAIECHFDPIPEVAPFHVNEFLTLKYENNETQIYVDGKRFRQCKYLAFNLERSRLEDYDSIRSIDEAEDLLNHDMEDDHSQIPPRTEFWGHCSNLQAWAENEYNTNILHRSIAFPLLKALTDAGDPKAKRVFKDEIARRFIEGCSKTREYLLAQCYLDFLDEEELGFLLDEIKDPYMRLFMRCFNYFKPKLNYSFTRLNGGIQVQNNTYSRRSTIFLSHLFAKKEDKELYYGYVQKWNDKVMFNPQDHEVIHRQEFNRICTPEHEYYDINLCEDHVRSSGVRYLFYPEDIDFVFSLLDQENLLQDFHVLKLSEGSTDQPDLKFLNLTDDLIIAVRPISIWEQQLQKKVSKVNRLLRRSRKACERNGLEFPELNYNTSFKSNNQDNPK